MKNQLYLLCMLCFMVCVSQEKEFNTTSVRVNKYVEGTLVTPYSDSLSPLVIFVMDAGAINRDGNDRMSRNDTFKKLSHTLAKAGVATFSYDKRLFKIDGLGIKESEVSFDHFIQDAQSTIEYFKKNGNYTKVIIAGHGQGSLVGMIAAQGMADGFISIGGNGIPIDKVIIDQIAKQAPGLDKSAAEAFKQLKEVGRATGYDPALSSIFGYNLQPFMKSWIQYDPSEEIAKLEIPILIIHGDKDIQVELSQAERLKQAAPNAEYVIIENMNHILKEIKGNRLENHKSYNESWRKIMPQVITSIVNFVKPEQP